MQLGHEFGLWALTGVTVATPDPATDTDLELARDPRYITAVRTVSGWAGDLGAARGLEASQLRYARTFGLGIQDNPVFPACTRPRCWWPGRPWPRRAQSGRGWPARGQHGRQHTPRDGRPRQRVRRLQRCRDRDRVAAGPRRRADRLHGASTRTTATGCRRRSGPRPGRRALAAHRRQGYELVRVVPRTWTHLLAEAAGQPVSPAAQTPVPWREHVGRRTGGVQAVRVRLRAGPPGRPGDHGHPQRVLPSARADAPVTGTPR
jgi:hypothetical protein